LAQLIAIPVILLLTCLQISLSGKFMILDGFADIILVWITAWVAQTNIKHNWFWIVFSIAVVCYISALPWYSTLISYVIILAMSIIINRRLWQSPFLSFLLILIIGSLFYYFDGIIGLKLSGSSITVSEAFLRITLPSIIMNLVIAFPIYLISRDMIHWVYPGEVENVK
jgi:hypothetical protein